MSMVISCSVYRLGDGLLLCQSHDSDRKRSAEAGDHERRVFAHIRQQHLAGSLGRHTALSGEGEASFFVLSDGLVCYLALSPRDAYKDAVMSCLEEVRKSFHEVYSHQEINSSVQPYALINFDRHIIRIVRKYDAQGGNPQVLALKKELNEVAGIVQQSLEDVLGRGEKLGDLHQQSVKLRNETSVLKKKSQALSRSAFFKKYGPPAAVGATVLIFVWWKLGFSLLFFL